MDSAHFHFEPITYIFRKNYYRIFNHTHIHTIKFRQNKIGNGLFN